MYIVQIYNKYGEEFGLYSVNRRNNKRNPQEKNLNQVIWDAQLEYKKIKSDVEVDIHFDEILVEYGFERVYIKEEINLVDDVE